MNKKKLLFVVNVDWTFLSHRLPIAIAAIKAGWEVHIACALTDKAELLRSYGLIVHHVPFSRSGMGLYSEAKTFFSLLKTIKSIKPNLVHLVTIKPVLYGGLAARVCAVPAVVAAVPGLGFIFMTTGVVAFFRRKLVSIFYKSALFHENIKVIFQNPDDKQLLINIGAVSEQNSTLIRGSGVDLTTYQSIPESDGVPVIILLARMLRDKGVLEFVKAAEIIKSKGIAARFLLIGDTDANPTSLQESDINTWVSAGTVEWLGHRSDVIELLQSSNIVALPSYREGLPKTLIEAAACGRAVVTTDVPGCRDAIESGQTGLLIPPRDAEALANAIETLLCDDSLRREMGRKGRVLAERYFSIDSVVSIHLNIYNNLIMQ